MSDIAIRVGNLSKLYRIGQRERYYTLRDTLTNAFTAPFYWLRNGRSSANTGISSVISNSQSAIRHSPFLWALKDVSFEVKRGEVLGIIGRNGVGKSTLLKILSRITEPTEGFVEIHGRVGSLLEVGTGFHPELTGRENVYLNGAILGMKKFEIGRKFDEIVAFAEVEKFIDTPIKHYSSGMYVRLAFAVAAHLQPEILLVDEVLAVGDIAFQKKCLGKMGDVAKEGRTVLLVSHNMQTINSLGTRAICLEDGRVIDSGKSTEVTINYLRRLQSIETDEAISDSKRAAKSNDLSIKRLLFLNSKGEKTSTLYFKEQFAVRLLFEVEQPVADVRFGIAIFTLEGTRISVTHHTDEGLRPLTLGKGCYSITARIQNLLVPGSYILSVGAHDLNSTRALDWIPQAGHFTVLGFSQEGIYLHDDYNAGFTYVPARWTEVTDCVPITGFGIVEDNDPGE